jgi:hypothetical protein
LRAQIATLKKGRGLIGAVINTLLFSCIVEYSSINAAFLSASMVLYAAILPTFCFYNSLNNSNWDLPCGGIVSNNLMEPLYASNMNPFTIDKL